MTFTKLFSSITESSIWMQDDHTRIVWIAMLAMADKRGRVWSSVPGLANRSRVPVESVERAINIFLAPDAYSRTRDHEGRRIEAIDGGWRLLNHQKYRDMRDDESRLEYKREWDRENRPRRASDRIRQNPTESDTKPTQAESREQIADSKGGRRAPRFSLPTVVEVKQEAEKIGLPESEADKFHDYYTANGWQVGRSPMKDWKAALRNWQRRNGSPGTKGTTYAGIPSNPRNAGTY